METELRKETEMHVCQQCGYIYDPSKGDRKGKVSPGIFFEDLPDDWTCPLCGAKKPRFSPML
jgi:rubredoxin